MRLNLEATTKEQQKVKAYLEANASDILAEKINNGVRIQKDGKTLLNKKTLSCNCAKCPKYIMLFTIYRMLTSHQSLISFGRPLCPNFS